MQQLDDEEDRGVQEQDSELMQKTVDEMHVQNQILHDELAFQISKTDYLKEVLVQFKLELAEKDVLIAQLKSQIKQEESSSGKSQSYVT